MTHFTFKETCKWTINMIRHMPVSHSPLRNIIILSSKGFHSAVLRTAFFFSLPYSVCIPLSFQRTAEKRTGVRVCAPLSSELVTVYVSSSQMTMWLEILLKQTFNQIQSLMRPSLILSHFLSKASLRLSPTLAEERLSAGLPYQQRQMGLLIVDRHADSWSHFIFIYFLSKITENALRI